MSEFILYILIPALPVLPLLIFVIILCRIWRGMRNGDEKRRKAQKIYFVIMSIITAAYIIFAVWLYSFMISEYNRYGGNLIGGDDHYSDPATTTAPPVMRIDE